jgi:AcrR family transcriptional regulator
VTSAKYKLQRAEAVRAAARIFAEKGFHGSSTKDIAAELGIQQGSLYYYFSSKEEALEEVCLLGIRAYVHRMDAIAASGEPFEAKLLSVITSHLTSYRENNEALKVHNDQRLYLPEERRTTLKELGSHYRELLEGILKEGVDAGALRGTLDCHFAAQAIIGICNAWGDHIVRDPNIDLFAIIYKCNDLLINGFSERRRVVRTDEDQVKRHDPIPGRQTTTLKGV